METMSKALDRLGVAGFDDELMPDGTMLRAVGTGIRHDPAELAVVETVRFEGPTDPADEAVVFALTNASGEPVGTFTMGYGPAAGADHAEIVERLHRPCFDEADIRAHQEHDHLVAVFDERSDAEAAVDELRRLGLGSDALGVAVHGPGQVAFEHDAEADLAHDLEVDVGAGAVVGFLAGFALVGTLVPVVGAVGVGGLLALGAATGFGGAMLGGYLGVAADERPLTVHEQIARTRLLPGQVLVAVCSHGHPDAARDVLQRHGGDLRTAPSA
ncbi:hypothetical protein NHL50_16585 [Acidimicrobiia bacterium EGI L10123]|uniref:hypothetical protein n=1 Tax=Salinilacustrithrix flava TaxID=2957203 RepID=UPI003D7C18EB|nr:hypothetical protein [Acidimicrobiia bacterium EGI L10123]